MCILGPASILNVKGNLVSALNCRMALIIFIDSSSNNKLPGRKLIIKPCKFKASYSAM